MSHYVFLLLFATAGAWLLVMNLQLLRSTYKLKLYMTRRDYTRLQGRHLGLMVLGIVLLVGGLVLYVRYGGGA
ncbi:MAG TPA: hypothetical protein VKA50_08210 [Gammaproteobacteria bacterium]|nr:hypothetical protein [Gammaproteobacteria bacterium]